MANQFQRVRSAVTDGRAQAPRYIQKQLLHLHDALQKSQTELKNAIRRDNDYSSAEADMEIYVTLKALKAEYESIDFAKAIEQEYSIAHNKDNASRRLAVGCAYIIPCQHSRLYSVIQPVSAAIAAGNCIIIEMGQTLAELGSLLRKIFLDTMDKDTFAVVDSKPSDQDFFKQHCVIVDGRSQPSSHDALSNISSVSARTIAIVDRTADIKEAARSLVLARTSFRGQSPYSPDLILVNEFVMKDFCNAAARQLTDRIGSSVQDGSSKKAKPEMNKETQKRLQSSTFTSLISGSSGSIMLVDNRDSTLEDEKIAEPILFILSMSSLDDAIDAANSTSNPLLAAYLFSDSKSAKYLSQFINTRASFTNHIPLGLLVGPIAPTNFPLSIENRYTKEMFSSSRPEYITPSPQNVLLTKLLAQEDKETSGKINNEMASPLSPMNEPVGHALGFFEQGLVTGGTVAIASLLTSVAVVVRFAGPAVIKRFR